MIAVLKKSEFNLAPQTSQIQLSLGHTRNISLSFVHALTGCNSHNFLRGLVHGNYGIKHWICLVEKLFHFAYDFVGDGMQLMCFAMTHLMKFG